MKVHLDDTLIFSKSLEDDLALLDKVLTKLSRKRPNPKLTRIVESDASKRVVEVSLI